MGISNHPQSHRRGPKQWPTAGTRAKVNLQININLEIKSRVGRLQELCQTQLALATRERAVKDLCAEMNAAQTPPLWWVVREFWSNARLRLR